MPSHRLARVLNPQRFVVAAFGLVGFLFAGSLAQAAAPEFQRKDVFDLEWVAAPQISPDGRQVVYERRSMDIMNDARVSRLWLINVDGTGHEALTGRDQQEGAARWSPDGSKLAYVSRTEHGGEIFVYWLASGKSTRVTQLPRAPSQLRWSPDGTQLSFAMLVPEKPSVLVKPMVAPKGATWADKPRVTTRLQHERDGSGRLEPGYRHFFVLPAAGGAARQVTQGSVRNSGAAEWTADGQALIFSGNHNPDWEFKFVNSEIYRLDLDSLRITALTDRDGPDTSPVVSPDGKLIAYIGFKDKVQAYQVRALHLMNADGSDKRLVRPDLDRSVTGLHFSSNSKALYYQYPEAGEEHIAISRLSGRSTTVATELGGEAVARPYGGGSFSVSNKGLVAYSHSTPDRPAQLAVADGRGNVRVITDLSGSLLKHRTLGQVEEVRYKASTDGLDIQGWLVKPPNYDPQKRYPLLVENHGGPISFYGPHFSPEVQLYAAAGYLVFYPNPRGSTGYGEAFANLLYNNYPGDDYVDVMDGIDHLIAQGLATEGALYVTGGSAGGIMTAWMVSQSDRFRAAAVVKPVMNWISKTLTADNYFGYANYRYPGQPWENIETYMKFSPVSRVGSINTPTLVMVGDEDLRTPLSEAKQLYHALKLRQIDTALIEMPGASHFIAKRPSQLVSKVDHVLAWFANYPVPE